MKRRMDHNRTKHSRGESMVIAVVLMLAFFILGMTVLTAAAGATSSVNARMHYRQSYYYARSLFDIVDDALQHGALGERLRAAELERLLNVYAIDGTETIAETGVERILPITFLDNVPDTLVLPDGGAKLTYDVMSSIVPGSGGSQANVSLVNAALTIRVSTNDKIYGITVTYRFGGWATRVGDVWNWTGGWRVRSIG